MEWLMDLWHLNNVYLYINNLYIIILMIMFLFFVLNSFPIASNLPK